MISRLIAITLILAMISSTLSKLLIYADFKSNQKYIAAVLCENKEKPKLNCQGKCYLTKKLKEAEEKEKKQENNAQKKNSHDLFFITKISPIFFAAAKLKTQKPVAANFQLPMFDAEIPHPPPCFSLAA
jgi:hypothetical protein